MRIRKHAKISPAVYTTSSLKGHAHLQTHVCQLNQSPWDVMKFSPPSTPPPPPPPPQVDGDGACGVNASSADCISVTEREQSESSDDIPAEESPPTSPMSPPSPPPPAAAAKEKKITFCFKTDGKSWRCKREAAEGSSLCDHHIAQAKSYNNGYYAANKPEKVVVEAQRPARIKKASVSTNPHEFYYYSGFGPWWGKKRGEASTTTTTTTANPAVVAAAAANSKSSNNAANSGKSNNGSLSKNVESEVEMVDDESDSDDYGYEEDTYRRDKDNKNGKKRVRKPIKARSLKSLM